MEGCSSEGMEVQCIRPVLAFYNYHSVPLPLEAVRQLTSFVAWNLPGAPLQFVFVCDVRRTPPNILEAVESSFSSQIQHASIRRFEDIISHHILLLASIYGKYPGTIALITDSEDTVMTVKELLKNGWDVVIFHPPKTSSKLLDAASIDIQLPIHCAPMPEKICNENKNRKLAEVIQKEIYTKHQAPEFASCGVSLGSKPLPVMHANPISDLDIGFEAQNPLPIPPHQAKNPFAPHYDRSNPFNMNAYDTSFVKGFTACGPRKSPGNVCGGFGMAPLGQINPHTRQKGPEFRLCEDKTYEKRDCPIYHPRLSCCFFPNCKLTAEVCFYAPSTPFYVQGKKRPCKGGKDPQLNHIHA